MKNGTEMQQPLPKRLLAALFALVLVVGLVPVSAWAEGDEAKGSSSQEQVDGQTGSEVASEGGESSDDSELGGAADQAGSESDRFIGLDEDGIDAATLGDYVNPIAGGTCVYPYDGTISMSALYTTLKGFFKPAVNVTFYLKAGGASTSVTKRSTGNLNPHNYGECSYEVSWGFSGEGSLLLREQVDIDSPENPEAYATYDGQDHKWEPTVTATVNPNFSAADYVVSYYRGDNETSDFKSTGQITVKIQGTGNYSYVNETRSYTIQPIGTMTVACSDYEGSYDGQAHGEAAVPSVTEGTAVEYSTDGQNWHTDVPKVKDVSDAIVQVRAINPGYGTAYNSYVLKVSPAAVTAKVEGNSATYAYDNTTHSVSGFEVSDVTDSEGKHTKVSGLYNKGNVKLAPNKKASAGSMYPGTYVMGLDASSFENKDPNFDVTFEVTDGVLTVNKAKVTVYIEGESDTFAYNGKPQSVSGFRMTDIEGESTDLYTSDMIELAEGVSVEVTGTAVGTYYMGLDSNSFVNGNAEYFEATFVVTKDGSLTINPANTMTVSCDGYEGTYDGEEHAPTATANVPDGTDATIEYSLDDKEWSSEAPAIKDVDKKTVYVRAVNSNYVTATTSYTLEVTPATATVAAEPASKAYGQDDPEEFGATVAGTFGDDVIKYEVARPWAGVDEGAGTYEDAIVPTGETSQGNYSVEYVPADFTINPAEVTVYVEGNSDTVTYDGKKHSVKGYKVAGIAGTSSNLFDEGSIVFAKEGTDEASGTDAGTYKMGLASSSFECEDANFDVTFDVADGTLTVNKRAIEVSDSATLVYNGQEQAFCVNAANATGLAEGEVLTLRDAQVKGTEPGVYTEVSDFTWEVAKADGATDSTGNYTIEVSGQLTITSADAPGDGSGSASGNGSAAGNGNADKAGSSSAKTGDSVAPFAAGAGIVAAAAALAAFLVSRKLRGARR